MEQKTNQVLAGGALPYQAITVDQFPSAEAAQNVFDAVISERQAGVDDLYALIVRPTARLPRVVKNLGFLTPLFSRLLGITFESPITDFAELANPETGPIPETIAGMKAYDQTTPFYMMNLDKYFAAAQ